MEDSEDAEAQGMEQQGGEEHIDIWNPPTDDIEDPTPEEEAEILGKEPPQPEGDAKKVSEDDDKGGDEDPNAGDKEPAEDGGKTFTQEDVDRIVKERLSRDSTSQRMTSIEDSLAKIVEQISGKVNTGQQELGPTNVPDAQSDPEMIQDVGKFLGDPRYNGWSMARLKSEAPEHYNAAYGRIINKMDIDRWLNQGVEQARTAKEDEEYDNFIQDQLAEVKKLAPDYFNESGKYNEKFKTEVVEWGASQGILNPLVAFRMKNAKHFLTDEQLNELLDKAREEGKNGIIKKAQENEPIQKGSNKGNSEKSQSFSDMSDEQVQNMYANGGSRSKEARTELIRRGILA